MVALLIGAEVEIFEPWKRLLLHPVVAFTNDAEVRKAVVAALDRRQEPRRNLLLLAAQMSLPEFAEECRTLVEMPANIDRIVDEPDQDVKSTTEQHPPPAKSPWGLGKPAGKSAEPAEKTGADDF
jgi:hypothetical protein